MIPRGKLPRLLCLTAALASPVTASAQTGPSRGAAVIDSMPRAKSIQQTAISPDGTQVAYVVGGQITIAPIGGGSEHSITVDGKQSQRSVAWSADSKHIVFIDDLEGNVPAAQVWTTAADGSAPVKRADLKGYVDDPTFSPDGSRIALLFIEGMPRVAGPLQPMLPLAGEIESKVYEQRLAMIDLSSNIFTQITPADMYVYEYDWTPDGRGWAVIAAHGEGDANWYVAHLYRVEAATGTMQDIYAPKLQIAEPRVSPDSKNVAFIAGIMSDEGSTGGDIFIVPIAGGKAQNITPGIKSSPSSLRWTGTDQITFAENVDGQAGLSSVGATGGVVKTLWRGDESIGSLSFSRDGSASAMIRQSASAPSEAWAGPIGQWKQITSLNSGVKPEWGETRNFHWTNGNLQLQGWLMLPKDYDASKKYPLVVNVHGGPSSACRNSWDPRGMGSLSAMGYFALCPNPRGSYGQGEAFTRANVKDFGGGDFRDIMAGIDAILKQYPVDPKRLGIRGHSYGGYMTLWAETQTHRFAAAVAGAGLSDWLSYYGVNDIDEWMIPFFGASVYDDPAVYAKSDPMHFVKNVKTPTLILVGDSDGEVPMEQSVEWWHALNTLKVPTRLVVYPHEGHVFVNPADWRDYFVRSLDWFEEWFGKAGDEAKK